jgi:hypothetical protein
MVTETVHWPRRAWLRAAFTLAIAAPLAAPRAGRAARATAAAAATAAAPRFFAAWDADGTHHIGRIAPHGGGWRIESSLEVPTRAHGLVALPGGALLAVARRPGDWLVRWHPQQPDDAVWHWIDPDRSFNGHALPLGEFLYTTETDNTTGAGLLVRHHLRSFERLDEWSAQGIDTHALLADGRGGVMVANGGITTQPETGRAKIDLANMDSSLVRLDAASGVVTGTWRLADRRQSLRHLAWHGQTLGIALQAQHDDPAERNAAPVLALLEAAPGAALRSVAGPAHTAGYGGDIAADREGFLIGCPRIDAVARWAPDGRWLGTTPFQDACAVAVSAGSGWAAGPSGVLTFSPASTVFPWDTAFSPDNHVAPALEPLQKTP